MTEEIEIPLASTDKYEEALAKARFEYKENPCATESEKRVLEIIFPELKESEDEKIRQALIAYFRGMTHDVFVNGFSKEDFIAWFEKQKDAETEKEKAYKNADKIQYEKGFEDGVASVKQKEQKPIKNDLDAINLSKILAADRLASAEMTGRLKERNEILENPEKYGLQKPAEWSEEDEDMIRFYKMDYNNEIWDWPTKRVVEMRLAFKDWLCVRLESLRPQPHWKPSEEQMESLAYAIQVLNSNLDPRSAKAYQDLQTLYKNIKYGN